MTPGDGWREKGSIPRRCRGTLGGLRWIVTGHGLSRRSRGVSKPSERGAASVDRRFMVAALREARRAEALGEVPIGAVVVLRGVVIGRGGNCPITGQDPTAHAEICALRAAARRVGNYRLTGATLYATVEPCVMCVGACLHARVARLVFGTPDDKAGAIVSRVHLLEAARCSHRVRVTEGVLASEARRLIQEFFRMRRAEGYRSGRTGLDSKSSWG